MILIFFYFCLLPIYDSVKVLSILMIKLKLILKIKLFFMIPMLLKIIIEKRWPK